MKQDWQQGDLEQLNRDGVFYLRGENMSRLETFVDAAFAFAITMLVISVDNIPDNYDDFVTALLQTPAFIACFFQLAMFWMGHRAWSRRYALETTGTLWTSLLLVAGVLVIVYPLRVMFSAGFGFLSNEHLPVPFQLSFEQIRSIFLFYGTGFGVLCALIASLFWQALKHANHLALTPLEHFSTRIDITSWLILSGTGWVSCLIALSVNGEWVVLAGWLYAGLGIVMPLHSMFARKALGRQINQELLQKPPDRRS